MKKQIKYKLENFAEIRNFAETKQRRELIDSQVRSYLVRRCKDADEMERGYIYYRDLNKSITI